ncbi:Ig-like domain-containing protein [Lachnospiraceae bacterium 45-W7]
MKYLPRVKKALVFLLVFALAVSAFVLTPPAEVSAAPKKYVKSLKVSAKQKVLKAGAKTTIKATVSTKGAAKKNVKASISNKNAASIKVGKPNKKGVTSITVTAKKVTKKTTATIKVTTVDKNARKKKISKSIKLTVNPVVLATVVPQSITAQAETATINVGGTTVVKATVLPANAADKSVTYNSSDPKVATVDANGIVVGIGAGTARITVSTSNGKTAWVDIRVLEVSVTSVTIEPENEELTVTGSTKLSAKILPQNATIQTLTWESSDANIVTVDKDGIIRGVSEGTAVIRATASNGVYGECNVKVKKEVVEADGVSIEVTNPYIDKDGKVYPETALIGNDMIVRARVIKEGQPVGNTSVTLSMAKLYGNCPDAFCVRTPTEKTDDNGYVNFVVGLKTDQNLDALSEKFQSYLVKAQESSSNVSQEMTVKFASVRVNGISVLNGTGGYPAIKPSTYANPMDNGLYATWYIDENKTEEYVTSQQNSSNEGDDNRVYFSAAPELLMPVTKETARDEKWEYSVTDGTSGPCSIYNDATNETTTVQIEKIPAGLRYLNLRFNKIDISRYTTMNIDIYSRETGINLHHKEVTEGQNESDLIQIEEQWDVPSYLVVSLVSQGQVDTDSQGYILTKLEGVWASTNDERNEPEQIQGSVKWTNVSEDMGYENSPWTYEEARRYFPSDSSYLNSNYKYSYRVPGFPHTGDAMITVEDTQGNKTTFLYPTVNNGSNKNVLAPVSMRIDAVMIANEALNKKVGTLTTQGDIAVVDARELGVTSLKAEISIEGLKNQELGIGNGGVLYTSVQWVNVPNEDEVSESEDYFAIEGQEVTVTAQLYDKNGTNVATPNKQITFSYEEDGEKLKIDLDGSQAGSQAALVDVSNKGATDGDGVVKITFRDITSNEYFSFIEELTAESSDKNYNVRLTFDGKEYVKSGNIYWVDLGLTFVDSAVDADTPERTTQFDNELKSIRKNAVYTVSDKKGWNIGYQVVARSMKFRYNFIKTMDAQDNILEENVHIPVTEKNEFVRVSGVPVRYETDNRNVNLISENNTAKLFSTVAGNVKLTGMFDLDHLVPEDVTFTYFDENGEQVAAKNIGKGKPTSMGNAGLVVTTSWQTSGTEVQILAPEMIYINTPRYVYVKVVDSYGNPIEGADVKYVINGVNAQEETYAGMSDENGLVSILLPPAYDISATTSTIKVTVKDSLSRNATITYTDKADGEFAIAADETNRYAVEVGADSKTIELYFTNNVLFDTLNPGQFTLERDDGTPYTIRSVEKGSTSKSVILTLDEEIVQKSAVHTLKVHEYEDDKGILYVPTDRFGQIITESEYTFKPADRQKN